MARPHNEKLAELPAARREKIKARAAELIAEEMSLCAMRPDLSIRFGLPADGDCIAALGSQTWLHTYATKGIRPAIARFVQERLSPAAFRSQLERPDTFTLLAAWTGISLAMPSSNSAGPASSSHRRLRTSISFLFKSTFLGRASDMHSSMK